MALKASLSVLLGCSFGTASRLLQAAETGDEVVVQQVLCDRPQLAAFTGFHGTTSSLHRAAAGGHLGVCRAIIEPLKQRIRVAEAATAASGRRSAAAAKWQRLLATVLNQRSNKSLTPLMLACEHGHASIAAYLLREGADPLAADFVHSRTCLHYAAVGGHADCLRLLCSDTAMVATPDGNRPLRDVIVSDMQVQACRFIDQRAFGGLTALHFAVVTGNLDAVQALLRGGASIMVKSDGEAYIGEDFLVPGSSPLHVAVIINNNSIVHAILQAHMEMMNILGTTLDERGRRPWEGTSRTDIRSVRNHFRKLPFHLARERHQPQLMSLVDPRIPIDVALDAARDTEHGIGPKRLSTICSLVLQRSLLQWLDNCQRELAREAAGKPPRHPAAPVSEGKSAKIKSAPAPATTVDMSSPPPTAGPRTRIEAAVEQQSVAQGQIQAAAGGTEFSPFAVVADEPVPTSPIAPSPRPVAYIPGAASAPVSPAGTLALLTEAAGPVTEGAVPSLNAAAAGCGVQLQGNSGAQRMASLHGYMGMLSLKRPPSTAAMETAVGGGATVRSLTRQLSGSVPPHQLPRSSSGAASMARVRFLTDPTGAVDPTAVPAGLSAGTPASMGAASVLDSPRLSIPGSPRELPSPHSDRRIKVMPGHRRSSSQGNVRLAMGTVFNVRRRSGEGAVTPPLGGAGDQGGVSATGQSGQQQLVLGDEKEKDWGLDSEGEPESPRSPSEDAEDMECGVCLDAGVEVAFASCQHKLCLACARNLTQQNKKPPHCPFCRRLVVGFQRVSATGLVHGGSDNGSHTAACGQQDTSTITASVTPPVAAY